MKTLSEVLRSVDWPQVRRALARHYPDEPKSAGIARSSYRPVFEALRAMEPSHERVMVLLLQRVRDGDEPWVDVSGVEASQCGDPAAEHWACAYRPWRDWVGYLVPDEALAEFGVAGTVAHCLWELTWGGFGEAEQAQCCQTIQDAEDEALGGVR